MSIIIKCPVTGLEVDEEIEARARVLCLAECRAAICVDSGRCTNSWPGNGSGSFGPYIRLANLAVSRERTVESDHG